MPLMEGYSRKAIRENIRRSRKEGKPLNQSIAIAMSKAGKKPKDKKRQERGKKALVASTRG